MPDLSINNNLSFQPWKNKSYYCHDLPTKPKPGIGRILVTGASGYIGGRLVPELTARGYNLRIMVRASSPEYQEQWPEAEVAVADALDPDSMMDAMKDIDTAYYLIHSLLLGPKEFESSEIKAAANFREAAEKNNVRRIIYLGGLGDIHAELSSHLRSRILVAEELQKGKVPLTILRAAIVIGAGSASYEIIEHLVKRLPVIFTPNWSMNSKCQPIAVRDVVKYLVGVLEVSETSGKSFDIGGDEIMTYQSMMKTFAEVHKLKRIFVPAPFSYIGFYSYSTGILTPVPVQIIRCLMEGLKNDTVCQNNLIKQYLPIKKLSYREALIRAMDREEQDRIYTRWSDAYPPAHELAIKLHELRDQIEYTTSYSLFTDKSASSLFRSISNIGGKEGWFSNNWMWRLRGILDRILLGVGDTRGRRSQSTLKVNDVIGFWRIEDLQLERHLLLRAEMKLPGKAWLEFKIRDEIGKRLLSVTPYYHIKNVCRKDILVYFSAFP